MSSMFKKKGGLAFKPKIPSARPRPAVAAPSAPAPNPIESQPSSTETPSDAAPNEATEATTSDSLDAPVHEPQKATASPKRPSQTLAEPSQRPATPSQPHPPSEERPQASSVPQESLAVATEDASANAANNGVSVEIDQIDPRLQSTADGNKAAQAPPATAVPPVPPALNGTAAEERPVEESRLETGPDAERDAGAHAQVDIPGPAPAAVSSAPKQRKKPISRKDATAKSTQKTTPASDGEEDTGSRRKKRQRNNASEDGDDAAPRPRSRKRKVNTSAGDDSEAKSKAKRARSATPEDAENQLVDLQQLTMADLTKDLRIGKKFSRHDELRDRERQARAKAKLQKEGDQADDGVASSSASPKPDAQAKSKSGTPGGSSAPAAAATSGPQFRIVDGQIVVDQSSLVMDRHARAAAAQAGEDMETIEENDFTRLITSNSFRNTSKLRGPNVWTDEETELFYRGLRMFGTEFEMISKMFPGKQRRHIKLKFNREERHNPTRIDAALIGEKTIKMDIDEYRAVTGAEFESVEAIEAEQRKIEEQYEAERQRVADEQAEMMRKKREELFANDDGDGGKRKRSGKKKGKQAPVAYGLNGEPIAQDS